MKEHVGQFGIYISTFWLMFPVCKVQSFCLHSSALCACEPAQGGSSRRFRAWGVVSARRESSPRGWTDRWEESPLCSSHSGCTSASSRLIPALYLLQNPLILLNSRKQRQITFRSNSVCHLEPFFHAFLGRRPLQRTLLPNERLSVLSAFKGI